MPTPPPTIWPPQAISADGGVQPSYLYTSWWALSCTYMPKQCATVPTWAKPNLGFCVSSDLMPRCEIHRCSCFCQPWTVPTAAASRQPRCPSSSSLGVMAEPGSPEAPAEAPKRHKGVTKWFNATKGYGFVTPIVEGDEQPEEIFVHQVRSE